MQAAPIGMALADNHGLITQANPALCDLLGRGSYDLVGLHVSALSHPDDRGIDDEMWTVLNSSQASAVTREKRLVDSDGRVVWMHNAIAAARDDQGTVANYVVQFLDVTQARLATEALDELAHHDPLTGLKNRRAVLEHVAATMAHRRPAPIAALFIDVDRFKTVNDSYGHGVGDALLAAIAARIVSCLRFGDTVGRIGGDEFLVVLHGVNDLPASLEVADKGRRAAALPLVLDGITLHPTISVGLSLPRADDTPDSLIARADRALYAAKESGRNRVACSD
jgi:diguanylate cyclase (GGDEF)-like protein/PAS domain S-box-containing protein